jgi:hypothetical protein
VNNPIPETGSIKETEKPQTGSNPPQTVIATPRALIQDSLSPKYQEEIRIVETSLAIPTIDIGTTPAR